MLGATKLSLQLRFSADYNSHTLPWHHLYSECAWLVHVLYIRQTALCVTPVLYTPEPVPRRSKLGRWPQNKHIGWGLFICADTAAISLIFYQEMPVGISMCRSMVTAIDTVRGECQCEMPVIRYMSRCSRKCVLDIRCVLSVFHPDALLKRSVFVQLIAKAEYIGL